MRFRPGRDEKALQIRNQKKRGGKRIIIKKRALQPFKQEGGKGGGGNHLTRVGEERR